MCTFILDLMIFFQKARHIMIPVVQGPYQHEFKTYLTLE
jgi:hypothetical protein